ncbi:hypothetical protein JW916_12070 [Candidatus Sumerlaeota bacterium]|nr:hypothetical protein [Candidatus Sumerlaeota bacterium]
MQLWPSFDKDYADLYRFAFRMGLDAGAPQPVQLADLTPTISPDQADRLLRKTQAESLKKEVFDHLGKDNWRDALSAGKQLWDEYPDTLEFDDLRRDEALRLLRRKIQTTTGRI